MKRTGPSTAGSGLKFRGIAMNSKFFDLKKEKQDRMINAALKVFAEHGYRHASTDDIVREAAISKGLLFHYFGSKLGLYSFIYDYSVRYMTLELRESVPLEETDLFTILEEMEGAKMRAMWGYPYMQQFLNRSFSEDVSEALLAIEKMRADLAGMYETIYGQVDVSRLPAGTDPEKLSHILQFTIDGLLTERIQDASLQPEMLYKETVSYIEFIRELVYGG